jgi:hypothetical protein
LQGVDIKAVVSVFDFRAKARRFEDNGMLWLMEGETGIDQANCPGG